MKDLKDKKTELEQSEKRLAQVLAERDRELERDKNQYKSKISSLESKLGKKKELIRDLEFECSEKEAEVEKMREELQSLKQKTKSLSRRI